ncbi:MAG: hypothetical protein IKM31_06760 [Oscillospiraceae bacterium]|nr:hypothetical protein [Oscillospiraceae bacterium]
MVFSLIGAFGYNAFRRKMYGIIGVPGSYFSLIGMMLIVLLIGQLFSGGEVGASIGEIIGYVVLALVFLAYMIYVMIVRCDTVGQRIMLPFMAALIAFGFVWRFLAALLLHIPMGNGSPAEVKSVFPEYLRSPDGETFRKEREGSDTCEYYCSRTGERVTFHSAGAGDEGFLPAGWVEG